MLVILENRKIIFRPRAILTHEMVQEIYDFPHRVLELKYNDYGDGIVAGLDYVTREDGVYLSKGIVKLRGEFYFLTEDVNLMEQVAALKEQMKGKGNLVKAYRFLLALKDVTNEGGIDKQQLELKLQPTDEAGEMELGALFNELNLKLPDQSVEIKKLYEEFTRRSRIGLLNVPYSHRSGTTFHPYIFKAVCNALKLKKNKNFLDYMLIVELENHGVVSLETLRTYIVESGLKLKDEVTRTELFEAFTKALQKEIKILQPVSTKSEPTFDDDDDDEESPLI